MVHVLRFRPSLPEWGEHRFGKRMIDIREQVRFCRLRGIQLLARPARNREASLLEIPKRTIVLAATGSHTVVAALFAISTALRLTC